MAQSWCNQRFARLRSIVFSFEPEFPVDSSRVHLVDEILRCSPRLEHLTVAWRDLCGCSQSNANVKHLCLELFKDSSNGNLLVDIERLSQLLPNLRRLETSRGHLKLNDNLPEFIVTIVDQFHQLVELILNSEGLLPVEPDVQLKMQQAIFNMEHRRLRNDDVCQIEFPTCDRVDIWFSSSFDSHDGITINF